MERWQHGREVPCGSQSPQGAFAMIDEPEMFDIVPFKSKSIAVYWKSMFTRSTYGTPDMDERHCILSEVSALADGFAGTPYLFVQIRTATSCHGVHRPAPSSASGHWE
jgi:hypothetical protein